MGFSATDFHAVSNAGHSAFLLFLLLELFFVSKMNTNVCILLVLVLNI